MPGRDPRDRRLGPGQLSLAHQPNERIPVDGVVALPASGDGAPRVLARLPETVPDGVAFDRRGRLLVSCFTPSRIWLVDGDEVRVLVDDPEERVLRGPTNVAFVPGTSTVVCANLRGTSLAVFEHDAPGAALPRPPALGPSR